MFLKNGEFITVFWFQIIKEAYLEPFYESSPAEMGMFVKEVKEVFVRLARYYQFFHRKRNMVEVP